MVRPLLIFAVLLSACVTAPDPEVRVAEPVRTIDIRSWPPGLVLELNGEYLGTTPLELVVNATKSGNWTTEYSGVYKPVVLRASTRDSSGWEQKIWWPGERIPSRVLFRIPGAMRGLAVN
jgi:starvation-inducible outer membrane lipoprotein